MVASSNLSFVNRRLIDLASMLQGVPWFAPNNGRKATANDQRIRQT
jgi:hypothetical protein